MHLDYAGVDWLTMTTRDSDVAYEWWNTYQKYRAVRRKEGDAEYGFHNGFYAGVRTASMSVGESETLGSILIVSGGDAERLFKRLWGGKKRVTRIDLCVDFALEPATDLAGDLFERASQDEGNKQRKFSLFAGSDQGKTFYLGSRQSTQYGRVYDKGIQSGRARVGELWRAEVEYKKPLAGKIAERLWDENPEQRKLAVCDTVSEWFAERNAELFPMTDTTYAVRVAAEVRVTTASKKLAWLRTQVSPTVAQLIEAGYGREVLKVLLLDARAIGSIYAEKI